MSAALTLARSRPHRAGLHHRASLSLGMAQLAPKGLAEVWWLKHLGDVHWQLIARALGQQTTVFRDHAGRQMYAAFCATDFEQHAPDLVTLGAKIDLQSHLWAAGRNRIQSQHVLSVQGKTVARFRLVSTFVAHGVSGLNATVRRAVPQLEPVLQPAPDDFAAQSSRQAKLIRTTQSETPPKTIPLFPSVGSDFNAVGLLYFPSFTRLFDELQNRSERGQRWRPVRQRQVYYFGNIEQGDVVLGAGTKEAENAFGLWSEAAGHHIAHCSVARFKE